MRKKHIFLVSVPLIFFVALFFSYIHKQFVSAEKVALVAQNPEPTSNNANTGRSEDNQIPDTPSVKDKENDTKNVTAILPDPEEKSATSEKVAPDITTVPSPDTAYPLHSQITSTVFWAGEDASNDNKHISNSPSAWDDQWTKHFGGVDDPKHRNGFLPTGFTPKENPFYVALPYNDFNEKGKLKQTIFQLASWTSAKPKISSEYSYCKNRWVKIIKGGKQAYAQWEDVGPFGEDDQSYVFGGAIPKSKTNQRAGIDTSPAVRDYLTLKDIDTVDWQFVDDRDVPDGPWKQVVTTSNVFWN